MDDDRSITDEKAAFIRSQIRLLSTPLRPSQNWLDIAPVLEDGEAKLGDKTVQDIIAKVNSKIKGHNRLVYSTQSQRHVAEQIDALYWNEVLADDLRADTNATWIKQDADLCSTESIEMLPENVKDLYPNANCESSAIESAKYKDLRNKLVGLNKKRDEEMQKLAMYRRLKELLQPFENAQENIQENLVTKDGELSRELERTRMLIARLMSQAGNMRGAGRVGVNDTKVVSNEEKLANVIGLG